MAMEWIENEFRDLVGRMAAFNDRVEGVHHCKPDAEIPISQSAIRLLARELRRLPVDKVSGAVMQHLMRSARGRRMHDSARQALISFARKTWPNDGAEGETVHRLCDELEYALEALSGYKALRAAAEKLSNGTRNNSRYAATLPPDYKALHDALNAIKKEEADALG